MRVAWITLGCVLVTVGSLYIAVSQGSVPVPPQSVRNIIFDKIVPGVITPSSSGMSTAIIWNIRMPRALLAMMVGAGLAIVGASLQAVTRNALSDPHLLGISSGGAFGAIIALLHTGLFLGSLTVPFLAFLGALGAAFVVLIVSKLVGATSADRIILAGVAVSFIIMAGTNILIFLGDPRAAHTVVFWMLGGLGLTQWSHLLYPFSILLLGGAWFWSGAPLLNAMALGDETASTLGISVTRFRFLTFVVAALVTGVMVAFSGIIGFVGLMIPHIARMFVGGDHVRVIPVSALIGSIFLLWADTAARTVMAPEDIPVGIVTGLSGGIFFVWLLGNRHR